MKNQTSSKNIILNYGLYLGIIGVIVHLTLWATGNAIELQWLNSVLNIAVMIAFIVLGIKQFRELNDAYITWGEGVKIGLGIVMVSAVISVIYTLLFMTVIAPDFQELAMKVQEQKWLDAGLNEQQIENATKMAKKFQSPGIISAMILGMSAFLGFVVSAIIAAIMKKTPQQNY